MCAIKYALKVFFKDQRLIAHQKKIQDVPFPLPFKKKA